VSGEATRSAAGATARCAISASPPTDGGAAHAADREDRRRARGFLVGEAPTRFQRDLHKRPVTTELVDAAIQRIEQKMLALGEREIDSRRLGEMVMEELRKLDKVAYIRFASVYKSFSDVEDFRDAIREVRDK
jgi:transcriptional regulator NrdR family protein